MTKLLITTTVAAALITAAPASGHLIAHHPKNTKNLRSIERSQTQNLKHAKYVCANGAGMHKRWSCHATKWLTRELNETWTALHPPVVRVVASRSTYSGGYGVALCGSSCVQCESGGNPSAVSPDGKYWGWYQFDYDTWVAHGGSPGAYGRASGSEQTAVASRMRYDGWPNC